MLNKVLGMLFFLSGGLAWAQHVTAANWNFAVSGDSRNCGDVVMPAIAKSVVKSHAEFYWHLGDFRAMYAVDEDMAKRYGEKLTLPEYQQMAWGDFIANQVAPFGDVPVHLGIGNHELIGRSVADYLAQFGYWLNTPEVHDQHGNAYAQDGSLKTYYHWTQHNVDFIYLDNSGDDGFDDDQLQWFENTLAQDKSDASISTIVVAMHRALPNSLACGHSMNDDEKTRSTKGTQSGRRAYGDLVQWKRDTKRRVYVLASHSHYFMQDLYNTPYWNNPAHGEVLPGWIIGTAGARRNRLPDFSAEMLTKTKAETDVWGYLRGKVSKDGEITFDFVEVSAKDLPKKVHELYGEDLIVGVCSNGNKDDSLHPLPPSCNDK